MNYKYWMMLVGLIGLVMLSGCSAEAESDGDSWEDNDRTNEELDYSRMNVDSPKGVESGLISAEFHNEMKEYFRLDAEFSKKSKEFDEKLNSFSEDDFSWEKEFREEYIEHLEEYSRHLNSVNISDSNDEEYKLTSYINNYGHQAMSRNLSLKEYLETLNDKKLDEHGREVDDTYMAMEGVIELLEEYSMYE